MKFIFSLFLPLIFFAPGCTQSAQKSCESQNEAVIDLNESTEIILSVIRKGDFSHCFTSDSPDNKEAIDLFIKNFSPAQMAFESEVLSSEKPVVLLFYDKDEEGTSDLLAAFNDYARKNGEKVKFVRIENLQLFKLTEQANISTVATLMLIQDRAEKNRIETISLASFTQQLDTLLANV